VSENSAPVFGGRSGLIELPMLPSYGGCRSWIEVAEDVPTEGSVPVLGDDAFAAKLAAFVAATGGAR